MDQEADRVRMLNEDHAEPVVGGSPERSEAEDEVESGDEGPLSRADRLLRFWSCGLGFDEIEVTVAPPDRPHALLEKLGPSPFARGGFPLIGFLATTYDKVTRFAVERE